MKNTPHETYSTLTSKEKRISTIATTKAGRRLELVTHKDFSGNLVTRVSAGVLDGQFFRFVMGRDFSRVLQRSQVRMTAKAFQSQHNLYLDQLDMLAEAADRYYSVETVTFAP